MINSSSESSMAFLAFADFTVCKTGEGDWQNALSDADASHDDLCALHVGLIDDNGDPSAGIGAESEAN